MNTLKIRFAKNKRLFSDVVRKQAGTPNKSAKKFSKTELPSHSHNQHLLVSTPFRGKSCSNFNINKLGKVQTKSDGSVGRARAHSVEGRGFESGGCHLEKINSLKKNMEITNNVSFPDPAHGEATKVVGRVGKNKCHKVGSFRTHKQCQKTKCDSSEPNLKITNRFSVLDPAHGEATNVVGRAGKDNCKNLGLLRAHKQCQSAKKQ